MRGSIAPLKSGTSMSSPQSVSTGCGGYSRVLLSVAPDRHLSPRKFDRLYICSPVVFFPALGFHAKACPQPCMLLGRVRHWMGDLQLSSSPFGNNSGRFPDRVQGRKLSFKDRFCCSKIGHRVHRWMDNIILSYKKLRPWNTW